MKMLILVATGIIISSITCIGQIGVENDLNSIGQNKYIIGFVPSKANNIYGFAVGFIGSEAICNKPYTKYSHGINLQIPGQGILQTFYIFNSPFKRAYETNLIGNEIFQIDTTLKKVIHNGLLLSLTGTFSDQVNGISISGWMSLGKIMNGLSINPLWNLYYKVNGVSIGVSNNSLEIKGVQFGIINKTVKLKGVQIGIWNKNEKRSLPLINWNFKD
jgi:hypothetical protein